MQPVISLEKTKIADSADFPLAILACNGARFDFAKGKCLFLAFPAVFSRYVQKYAV